MSKAAKLKGEVTTVIIQAASEACNAEGLAGSASDQKVNWLIFILRYGGEVAVQRHIGIVVRQHGARKRLNLAEKRWLPA